MKSAVKEFVQSCAVCQQSKYERTRSPGLLQPLPVPETAWQVISLDFIEGLPLSKSYNCILVVIDLLTKYGHFIPLKHPFTAAGVAQSFFHSVYRLHGLLGAIISDRDRIFTSQFWSELFKLPDVKLCRSTAYHPQSDGQTERLNQCLEMYLRCYVHACPRNWSAWLSSASSGITHVLILQLAAPHSKLSTATLLVCWPLTLLLLSMRRLSLGHQIGNGWINYYSSISTAPRIV